MGRQSDKNKKTNLKRADIIVTYNQLKYPRRLLSLVVLRRQDEIEIPDSLDVSVNALLHLDAA